MNNVIYCIVKLTNKLTLSKSAISSLPMPEAAK